MGWKDVISDVAGALQKPQGLMFGLFSGLEHDIQRWRGTKEQAERDMLDNIFDNLDKQGVDTSRFDYLRPKANSISEGLSQGWHGKLNASDILKQDTDPENWQKRYEKPGFGQKALGLTGDIVADPLNLLVGAGAIESIGGKLAASEALGRGGVFAGDFLRGAGTYGKLGSKVDEAAKAAEAVADVEKTGRMAGATNAIKEALTPSAAKAGQVTRRYLQGVNASGGDPMAGIMGAVIAGAGENISDRLMTAAAARLGSKAVQSAAPEALQLGEGRLAGWVEPKIDFPEGDLRRIITGGQFPRGVPEAKFTPDPFHDMDLTGLRATIQGNMPGGFVPQATSAQAANGAVAYETPDLVNAVAQIRKQVPPLPQSSIPIEDRVARISRALDQGVIRTPPQPMADLPMQGNLPTNVPNPEMFGPNYINPATYAKPPIGELGPAPTPPIAQGPIPGQQSYAEQFAQLLGKNTNLTMRPDELLRALQSSGRAAGGRFQSAQQKALLDFLSQHPESIPQILRSIGAR